MPLAIMVDIFLALENELAAQAADWPLETLFVVMLADRVPVFQTLRAKLAVVVAQLVRGERSVR